jgi:alpha-1,4-digalacturonate transport system substrate-binding protein
MKRIAGRFLIGSLILWSAASALSQETIALRFLCFNDGNECEVYDDLLSRFSSENPDISVLVDVAAEADVHQRLAAELEAGAPPDFARLSDLDVLKGHYLNLRPLLTDPEYLYRIFPDIIFRSMSSYFQDIGLYGYPDAAAVVAPFVNVSLFEQADVAVPAEGASWDEWLAALDEVVMNTAAAYALSVDNKDHRLVGPAMSLGADYYSGGLSLADLDGLRDFLEILTELMENGKTPADTLLGTGKSQEYFVRGETVMYICGSWKVEDVAAQVGDDFDWAIVANPAGPGGSTGVAQLTGLVAFAETNYPKAVGKVFEYLLQPQISAEFSARTVTIPGRADVAANGIDYQTDDEVVAEALNAFAREAPKLQDQAIALDLHPLASVYYEASNKFLRGYFAGDYTLDEALANLKARLAGA